MKGKGSRPDLQVAISGWENKVLGTESGKNFCRKWTLRKVFCAWFSLVQFSHSVLSDSLRSHGLQHARLPCPSPTPGAWLGLTKFKIN